MAGAASAQDKVTLIYSDTVSENDIRSQIPKTEFADCLGDGFDFQAHRRAVARPADGVVVAVTAMLGGDHAALRAVAVHHLEDHRGSRSPGSSAMCGPSSSPLLLPCL